MTRRFTIDGSDTLECHLESTCVRVREGVQRLVPFRQLRGILLGGGYGRGEGGVLKTPQGDKPYNDLEFYVFVRGNALLAERKFRHPLHELGERLSPEAGLEVEFKVLTVEKLRSSPPSMFYYDLVKGHRRILGDDGLLADCQHHGNARVIPLHEATRLLFNRCSGLLYALERLKRESFGPDEADFVGRNLAKARLAFGDVLLAAHGDYHWSCVTRHEALLKGGYCAGPLAWAEPVKQWHAEGVEFKLHPTCSPEPRETLSFAHEQLAEFGRKLWLWLEAKRLGTTFLSTRNYALSTTDKCPERGSLYNRLVNLRAFGPVGVLCRRYPRQRLFHALALLLWERAAAPDPKMIARAQRELRTSAHDFPGLVSAYWNLWTRFN